MARTPGSAAVAGPGAETRTGAGTSAACWDGPAPTMASVETATASSSRSDCSGRRRDQPRSPAMAMSEPPPIVPPEAVSPAKPVSPPVVPPVEPVVPDVPLW